MTGLEPATPGVTGRYSNQLSYNRPLRPLGLGLRAFVGSIPRAVRRQVISWRLAGFLWRGQGGGRGKLGMVMTAQEAYAEAERRIEQARAEGAWELVLSDLKTLNSLPPMDNFPDLRSVLNSVYEA